MDVADFIVTAIGVVLALVFGIFILPIVGVVLLVRWIYRRVRGQNALNAPTGGGQPYAYLDGDDVSQESVTKVVSAYVDDAVLGSYAQGVLDTFATTDRRRKGIFSILEQEFEQNSLTWDKFSAPVEVAFESIVEKSAQIANRMQAFDSKEFQRMGRLERAGAYGPDSPETTRLATMRSTLAEMDDIQAANDRLATELERLQADLTTMAGAGYATETEEIVEEIRRLSEDTKYYT